MTLPTHPRGRLPDPDPARVAGLELPPGLHVRPDPSFEPAAAGAGPYAWITRDPLPGPDAYPLWRRLAGLFSRTGLWPVTAEGLDGGAARPWLSGELGLREDPATADAATVLATRAEDGALDPEAAPTFPFTGLAAEVTGRTEPPQQLPWSSSEDGHHLMLVPVLRPADVPARLGWQGPVNHGLGPGEVSAVLRSWEDRFGAVLLGIGFATLQLQAGRVPTDPAELDRLVGEHHAFCPDNIDQGLPAGEYRAEVADQRPDRGVWAFWWD